MLMCLIRKKLGDLLPIIIVNLHNVLLSHPIAHYDCNNYLSSQHSLRATVHSCITKVQQMMPIKQEQMYAYSIVSTIMRDYKLKNTRNAVTTTTHAKSTRVMWNRLCGTERDFAKENGLPAAYLTNEQFESSKQQCLTEHESKRERKSEITHPCHM